MTEAQKEYIITDARIKKILELGHSPYDHNEAIEDLLRAREYIRPANLDAVLDELLNWCADNWFGAIIRPYGKEEIVDVLDFKRTIEKTKELRSQQKER